MSLISEWIPLIRRVFLFASFTENQLMQIARRMTLVTYPKGAAIYREGDAADCLFLVLSGSVRLVKKNGGPTDTTVAYLDRGDAMGEMSLLAEESRGNTALVNATADLLVLTKRDFDQILQKNPALGVHLSRVLSSRLAHLRKNGDHPTQPAKLYSLIPALPANDQILFAVNLGLAMVEQTRGKVLLVFVNNEHDLIPRSLGLPGSLITRERIEEGALRDAAKLEQLVMVHPSGLEFLTMHPKTFFDDIGYKLFSLLSLLKETYDYVLFVLPALHNESSVLTITESDRSFVVTGPQSASGDIDVLVKISHTLPPSVKMEKIWLSIDPNIQPGEAAPDVAIPWDLSWSREFNAGRSPFLPHQAVMGQRLMARLARSLSHQVVGFAMGSGAAFGYSLIGMLRVLEREGIFPDMIAGTSMGALIGSFYAAGIAVDDLEQIALSITKKKIRSLIDPTLPRSGLLRGNRVLAFLKEHLGEKTFRDLQLPFACVATDITSGKEVVLTEGGVADAVRASISLPFFFVPHYLDGRYLVDGGLVNPVPTSTVVGMGANILISANLTSRTAERRIPKVMGWQKRLPSPLRGPSILEVIVKTIYTMQYEISTARSVISHVVMDVHTSEYLWWDLHRAKELIRLGEASAEESLPKIKSLFPFFSDSCKVKLKEKRRKSY